jgi:hypothetical protein
MTAKDRGAGAAAARSNGGPLRTAVFKIVKDLGVIDPKESVVGSVLEADPVTA